jgi:hypothetical protein
MSEEHLCEQHANEVVTSSQRGCLSISAAILAGLLLFWVYAAVFYLIARVLVPVLVALTGTPQLTGVLVGTIVIHGAVTSLVYTMRLWPSDSPVVIRERVETSRRLLFHLGTIAVFGCPGSAAYIVCEDKGVGIWASLAVGVWWTVYPYLVLLDLVRREKRWVSPASDG